MLIKVLKKFKIALNYVHQKLIKRINRFKLLFKHLDQLVQMMFKVRSTT